MVNISYTAFKRTIFSSGIKMKVHLTQNNLRRIVITTMVISDGFYMAMILTTSFIG